jgi:hypothetical protein
LTYNKPLDYVYGLSSNFVISMIPMVLSFDDRPSPTSLEQDTMNERKNLIKH